MRILLTLTLAALAGSLAAQTLVVDRGLSSSGGAPKARPERVERLPGLPGRFLQSGRQRGDLCLCEKQLQRLDGLVRIRCGDSRRLVSKFLK